MTEAIIITLNMRGGCATVGEKVHALFRVNGRGPVRTDVPPRKTENELDRPALGN